jgi:hypothetical protein
MTERTAEEERRLSRALFRWAWIGGRYKSFRSLKAFVMPRYRQRWFQWRLRRAGRRAPAADLLVMLDSGGRIRPVTAWLIAAGRRADLRPAIEQNLLADPPSWRALDCCLMLACLGTEEDARILVTYLNWALLLEPEPEGFFNQRQPEALGALMYLDEQLGTDHAQQFLAEDGLWQRWPGSTDVSPADCREAVEQDVVFASGGDPGCRAQMKLELGQRKLERRQQDLERRQAESAQRELHRQPKRRHMG